MPTLSEIRADVQANWPSNYHSSDLDNDKTDEFINRVQQKICRLHNFTWMKQEVQRSTVDEQRKYALPAAGDATWTEVESGTVWKFKDEISTELINAENSREELRKRTKKQIEEDDDFSDLDDTGTPSDYCLQQGYLWLYHKPDHSANDDTAWTINLEQYGYLPDLSSTNTSNTISNDYPEVLEYGATAYGYRFGLDNELAEYWEGKMNEVIAEMVNDNLTRELATLECGMEPDDGQQIGA
jgi:hypothetical protein